MLNINILIEFNCIPLSWTNLQQKRRHIQETERYIFVK